MENNNKLLSIIIPTKNRYECLFPVIRTLLKNLSEIKDNEIEIIIQDNSENNDEANIFINEIDDQRVRYFHEKNPISVQENTILALENTKGKYIIFIGDDDLVSPYLLEAVRYIDKKKIECLVFNSAYYWWDSVDFIKESYYNKKKALWLPLNLNFKLIERDTKKELEIMLKSGSGNYLRLPKLYHGIITKEILENIKLKTGTYLPGSSPDIAFSTAISLVIEKYYFVNFPLSVYGASKNSGGGMTARKAHYGEIKDQKFLPKNIHKNWNKLIPFIWSEKTIYAQTVTEVLQKFNSNKKFNYLVFYGTMCAYEPYLLKKIFPKIISYCKLNVFKYLSIALIFIKKYFGIIYRKLKFSTKNYHYEVFIVENVDLVMEKLKSKKINLSDIEKQ